MLGEAVLSGISRVGGEKCKEKADGMDDGCGREPFLNWGCLPKSESWSRERAYGIF